MISEEEVIRIHKRLVDHGIQVWITGGWGIDALLREQTRPHKDLDMLVLVDDVALLRELLGRDGYSLRELWLENRWTVDARGIQTASAFVLHASEGRELDVHAMCLDDRGTGIPAWEAEAFAIDRQDLAGEGVIGGAVVRCLTPEMQMLCHTGYELPDKQVRDLELLHEKFGVGTTAWWS